MKTNHANAIIHRPWAACTLWAMALLSLTCFSVTPTFASNPEPSMADEGVGSTGGGNIIGSTHVSPELILMAVQEARPLLVSYFNYRQAIFESGESLEIYETDFEAPIAMAMNALDKKLFTGKKTIFDLIKQTEIEVLNSAPCLSRSVGPNGKIIETEADGAADSTKSTPVCISASRLSEKLIEDNYQPETQALVAHELSHLLGATEFEAEVLQTHVHEVLSEISFERFVKAADDYRFSVEAIDTGAWVLKNKFATQGSYRDAQELYGVAGLAFNENDETLQSTSFLSKDLNAKMNLLDLKALLLQIRFSSVDSFSPNSAADEKNLSKSLQRCEKSVCF